MPHHSPQEVAEQRATAARKERLDRSALLLTADVWREAANRIGPDAKGLTVGIVPFSRFIHVSTLHEDEALIVASALRMERQTDAPDNGSTVYRRWRTTFHDITVVLELRAPREVE